MIEVKFLGQQLLFRKYDSFWMAPLDIISDTNEATFEVYDENLNTSEVKNTMSFLLSEDYSNVKDHCHELLSKLAHCFWREFSIDPVFSMSGVAIGNVNQEVDFQLIFQMRSDTDGFGDDFANWVIDIKDTRIVGVRREQL